MDGNTPYNSSDGKRYYIQMHEMFQPINTEVATGRAHLNTPSKKSLFIDNMSVHIFMSLKHTQV